MNIKQISFIFLPLVCFTLSTYNSKSQDNQQHNYTIYTDHHLKSLYAPIIFSSSGIKNFFTNTFNRFEYAQEVLPNDFSHLIQLLDRSAKIIKCCKRRSTTEIKQTQKKARAHSKGIFRVFKNKIHSCSYISAHAFDTMLTQVIEILDPLMKSPILQEHDTSINYAYDLLYSSFSENFSVFKQQPNKFLKDLSYSLIDKLHAYYMPHSNIEELRSMLIRFLEVNLGKLVWHPEDEYKTWTSVKSIANHLANFVETGILEDTEDINDLYILLLERYIFFLDLNSNQLPCEFYKYVKEDVVHNSTILLELEEQEDFLETKMRRFVKALDTGLAKALSYKLSTQR